MLTFLYALTGIGSVIGAFLLVFTIVGSQSAPQQAAGAAMAIGLAIVPYVFSRCIQIIVSETSRRKENERLVTQLIALELAIAKIAAPR